MEGRLGAAAGWGGREGRDPSGEGAPALTAAAVVVVVPQVVIRRLPPSLTKEQLEEHLQPLPEHDYFEFFANDSRYGRRTTPPPPPQAPPQLAPESRRCHPPGPQSRHRSHPWSLGLVFLQLVPSHVLKSLHQL